MIEYHCSQCDTKYSRDEYRQLETVSRVTDDPTDQYGVETVCECGSRFFSDKWNMVDEVKKDSGSVKISTVALIIPHGLNQDQLYETCLFTDSESRVTMRYLTEDEAEEGHNKRVEYIKNVDLDVDQIVPPLDIN